MHEIISGDRAGQFQLISGPSSLPDTDIERLTDAAHGLDYDKTVLPSVESMTGKYTYRNADTLRCNRTALADKFVTTIYNIKRGKFNDFTTEVKRAVAINKSVNSKNSYSAYVQLWAGTKPQLVIVANLKDGFKQMEDGFIPSQKEVFKAEYIKTFGQEKWDKRITSLIDFVNSTEVFISKRIKDLSSAQ